MAIERGGSDDALDPSPNAGSERASRGGDEGESEALAAALERAVDGDVRFDEYTRVLYATDGGDATVVASGTSCRTQIGDFEGFDRPAHPVELLARGLESTPSE